MREPEVVACGAGGESRWFSEHCDADEARKRRKAWTDHWKSLTSSERKALQDSVLGEAQPQQTPEQEELCSSEYEDEPENEFPKPAPAATAGRAWASSDQTPPRGAVDGRTEEQLAFQRAIVATSPEGSGKRGPHEASAPRRGGAKQPTAQVSTPPAEGRGAAENAHGRGKGGAKTGQDGLVSDALRRAQLVVTRTEELAALVEILACCTRFALPLRPACPISTG